MLNEDSFVSGVSQEILDCSNIDSSLEMRF